VVGYANYDVGFLRAQNPNGILLLQPGLSPETSKYDAVSVTYGGIDDWEGGEDRLGGGADLGRIRPFDPEWDFLVNANGSVARASKRNTHPGWNLADPTGKGTPELVAKVFAYAAKRSGLYSDDWDGVHSDNWIFGAIGANWFYGPRLDTDRDGNVDDYTVLRRRWNDGLTEVGHLVRSYFPGKIVGGNGSWFRADRYNGSDRDGWLKSSNYTLIEHFDRFYDDPRAFLGLARRWLDYPDPHGQRRYLAVLQRALTSDGARLELPDGADPNVDAYMLDPGVMKSMRWGLTLAMMGDAYYEIYLRCHCTRWWYDEFDGGEGIRRRGYLGAPLGPPIPVGRHVWRRDFENGVAINNSSDADRTIQLGSTFYRIRGKQNPELNDGSELRTVTVPPHDGAILLRTSAS
jgi:hypothetical protein